MEKRFAQIMLKVFNSMFLWVYAFVFYVFALFAAFQLPVSEVVIIKSIVLYALVSALLPGIIIYISHNYSFFHIRTYIRAKNSNYIILILGYFISYAYFSLLDISIWFNIALLLPVYVILIHLFLRKYFTLCLDILSIGALTGIIFMLTVKFYFLFSIYPLIVAILISGLIAYCTQIMMLSSPKESMKSYLFGLLATLIDIVVAFVIG